MFNVQHVFFGFAFVICRKHKKVKDRGVFGGGVICPYNNDADCTKTYSTCLRTAISESLSFPVCVMSRHSDEVSAGR